MGRRRKHIYFLLVKFFIGLFSIYPSSSVPSSSPLEIHSRSPIHSPSTIATLSPSHSPSATPTRSPSHSPSATPTRSPSHSPSATPTRSPSFSPTFKPSRSPTTSPTRTSNAPTSAIQTPEEPHENIAPLPPTQGHPDSLLNTPSAMPGLQSTLAPSPNNGATLLSTTSIVAISCVSTAAVVITGLGLVLYCLKLSRRTKVSLLGTSDPPLYIRPSTGHLPTSHTNPTSTQLQAGRHLAPEDI